MSEEMELRGALKQRDDVLNLPLSLFVLRRSAGLSLVSSVSVQHPASITVIRGEMTGSASDTLW